MPINYSKWDALELSDDSDIEVHPNVDKRSFIRAKQNQIHQQREQRRHDIKTLQYERLINDGLLERINALLDALKKHQNESKNPDELVFQSVIESAGDPAKDEPPTPPEGVYTHQKETQPRYSKMMASLVDQVKKEVDEKKEPDRYRAYVDGVMGHLTKVQGLQQELLAKLAQLEKEENSKITSDSIHTGFSTSHIAKPKVPEKSKTAAGKQKAEQVELLNPKSSPREHLQRADTGVSSGAEADVEDGSLIEGDEEEDDSDIQPTGLGKQFAKIKLGNYRASLQFISEHPELVSERETDGLLVEAFNAAMKEKYAYAKTCVHQGLLIQYCRQLGRDGVGLFFKRITTPGHQAAKVFQDDVNSTFNRIKTRAAELSKETPSDPAGVEQIQLHAVDPNTEIRIAVPEPNSSDPTELASRKIFDSFPPGLQRALEARSLDKVNEVLGKMSVEEAEEIVAKLGEGNMLSLEEGIIDATNEEGQARLKEIERENKERAERGEEMVETEPEDTSNTVD